MRRFLMVSLMAFALPAHAAPWHVDVPNSHLTFTAEQAGDQFTGRFTQFTPVIDFDPAAPQTGKIAITIDMASVAIDDKDRRDSLPTEDWFFTEKFPTASFTSSNIIQSGNGGFTANGKLTLRGVTLDVALPFTLREEAGITHAEGSVILQRQQFGVGQGQWADDQWVKFPVVVKFHLQATPQK